jgi:MioC protein
MQLHQPASSPGWGILKSGRKPKVHRYESLAMSNHFCLEPIPNQAGYYMTSCRSGVQRGDHIAIVETSGSSEYQVDEIDFYSDPGDLWIAKLYRV